MKTSPKGKIKKNLDRLIQEKYVPLYPECLVCGEQTSSMHHYIQKKQSLYLRWKLKNLIPLCSSCHLAHHKKGDPRIVRAIIGALGEKWADEIEEDRRRFFKDTMGNLRDIEKTFDK